VDDGKAVAASNPAVITARSIEAAGHQPHEDYPQLVVQALTTFLK
jgi:pimeloyl-ACP methyl ester carboxylesterase